MAASLASDERRLLEMRAAARLELLKRKQDRKTIYGFYRPTGTYGGELIECLQETERGVFSAVDAEPDIHLAEKLKPLVVTPKRFKLVVGGRGSSKSIGVGSILAGRAKDYGDKAMCLREYQNSIEDSVHALLADQIRQHGWTRFEITDKAIRLNSEDVFKFRGIARNIDGVKSSYGFRYSWVEEAQTISVKSLRELTPSIREAGSELWFTLNPQSSADPISERFLRPWYSKLRREGIYEDELHLIVWLDYTDNPWHRELETERQDDKKRLSSVEYRHKWHGDYNDTISNALIPTEHFDAAIDAHIKLGIKPTGAIVASFDPSDTGPDARGFSLRHGSVLVDVCLHDEGDVHDGTSWALERALDANADYFVWDGDGMGVALQQQVSTALEHKHCKPVMFRGSMSPESPESPAPGQSETQRIKSNAETYTNRRAQYYDRVRHALANTYRAVVKGEYVDPDSVLCISSGCTDIEQLRSELCRIPRKPNSAGKIQILSKVDMARAPYHLPSPNLADAVMMGRIEPDPLGSAVKIKFAGWKR
jgi:phage terminase large subunit